jgi:ABC-type phosphate/phosphonate transport system substrate-binding protein
LNKPDSQPQDVQAKRPARSGVLVTVGAGALVLLLALGSLLWPASRQGRVQGAVMVLDPTADPNRTAFLYQPLTDLLERSVEHDMELKVVRDENEFQEGLAAGVDFVFCPDGRALTLDSASFEPLVTGRRSAPRNLRPRGVLLSLKSAGLVAEPWLTHASRTALGDSFSLAGGGEGLDRSATAGCAWGPDPYDHGPVIQAARLGAFDFVRVRQWDAQRFFDSGLLDKEEWVVTPVTVPVPDLVIMASRDLPATLRMRARETLSGLGRSSETDLEHQVMTGLAFIHLTGFNILLEPDFDRVRGIFKRDWPAKAD